jgi:hypothetical protein
MELFDKYNYSTKDKLNNFEKFISRQSLSRLLVRYELFKKTLEVKGSIVECGVHFGGGIMAWAKLSSALEPYAIHRKIIGFDTFEGFVDISDKDLKSDNHDELKKDGFKSHDLIFNELQDSISEYDDNRFLNQYEKVELVKGDANETIPEYLEKNQHLIVSLLFLDFDLYEPTKTALEYFLPRMPKGSVIAFDEVNNKFWSGETIAMVEAFKSLNNVELKKFQFDPNIAYALIK